ncbi:MAG: DUF72 domain-containing protein [Pyrinomonadaceae bacterium]|nr:DUF72 domain-containing protein [Pyrinomonadaceae bacterium]
MKAKGLIKVGCCGFRSAMAEYTLHYPVVEVQQTFYQPPRISTLERWRQDAPQGFEFTLKAWQLITHEARSPTYKRLKKELTELERTQCGSFRPTPIVKEAWATTLACAQALGARRILFQCPASFTPIRGHVENMRSFFASIERSGGLQFLWEPRGGWADDLIRTLCHELDLVHVVDPFATRTQTPDQCYFRLHGRKGWRYVYEDDELEELIRLLPKDKMSYVLFNNVRMREDAMRFQELIRMSESD